MAADSVAGNILVVEDELAHARMLAAMLESFGYSSVIVAHSGEQALSLSDQHELALALIDIGLRGSMDGVAVAAKLAERSVPVIYVTGYPDDENVRRAMATHPCGYLLKPVRGAELRAAVGIALRAPRGSAADAI